MFIRVFTKWNDTYMYVTCMYMSVQCMYEYLWVKSVKAMFWHIKWITSGTDDTPAQVLLPIPPSPSSTTGEGTSLCSAALCWPQNPVYNKLNSVNTCIYITYACFVLVCILSVHVHTVYIGVYNLSLNGFVYTLYTRNTCTYIVCTCYVHALRFTYSL